jgi:type II secretory pathway pseudopilin PulG
MKDDDAGFTMVELLIASVMFFIVLAALATVVATSSSSVETTRQTNDLNEQARLALNRVTRELRQAQEIEEVKITSGQITGLTFTVDFNGNGTIDASPADPERLTYCWDTANRRLLLTPDSGGGMPCDNTAALPILSSDVQNLDIQLRSNLWQYDGSCAASPTPDGVVTWQELDCAPLSAGVGNQNGVLDTIELRNIKGVSISLTVLTGARRQVYQTQVDMRNKA